MVLSKKLNKKNSGKRSMQKTRKGGKKSKMTYKKTEKKGTKKGKGGKKGQKPFRKMSKKNQKKRGGLFETKTHYLINNGWTKDYFNKLRNGITSNENSKRKIINNRDKKEKFLEVRVDTEYGQSSMVYRKLVSDIVNSLTSAISATPEIPEEYIELTNNENDLIANQFYGVHLLDYNSNTDELDKSEDAKQNEAGLERMREGEIRKHRNYNDDDPNIHTPLE